MSRQVNQKGEFNIKQSSFRNFISSRPGATFPPEKNRYHLYVSFACPWAHRTLVMRALKGLTSIITVSVVHWRMDEKGWKFPSADDPCEGATADHLYGVQRLREVYLKADSTYDSRISVPILWDKKKKTIVNNESSEIIRMLNSEFNGLIEPKYAKLDFYPTELQNQIDELNDWILPNINSGVYKAGFATKQEPYEVAVKNLFDHLAKAESILKTRQEKGEHYLLGSTLTEADVRLFTTIIRFDPVYVQHFKCNIGTIRSDFPHLHQWVRELYWGNEAFKSTTNFDHIKFHYTKSHKDINPNGITPLGPIPNIYPLDK